MPGKRLLDLFCGAGGAAVGYHRAGFDEIVGIDIRPMPRYPFTFVQADALEYVAEHGHEFDAIHASPPCQAYTAMQNINTRATKKNHPRLIEPIRRALLETGKPYVIENVPGAPLINPIMLCGSLFGLGVRRHRIFEMSLWFLYHPCIHSLNRSPIAIYGDHPQQPGDKTYRVNRARNLIEGQRAMGIDWMEWRELTQAVPPAYTEYIGKHLLESLAVQRG